MTENPAENPAETLRRAAEWARTNATSMRPGVSAATAELFDAAAAAWDAGEPWWDKPLALARVLLGETGDADDD